MLQLSAKRTASALVRHEIRVTVLFYRWVRQSPCTSPRHVPVLPSSSLAKQGVQAGVQLPPAGCCVPLSPNAATAAPPARCGREGRRRCEHTEPRSSRGSRAGACRGCRRRLCREAQSRAPVPRCCGHGEVGHCGRGSAARVWRDLPLELVLQICLLIPLPPALAGDLPQNARHHLPQGPLCPRGKASATARTKALWPCSADPPASSFTSPAHTQSRSRQEDF